MTSINSCCSSIPLPNSLKRSIVHLGAPFTANWCKSDFFLTNPIRKLGFSFKVDEKIRAVISGEGNVLSHPGSYTSPGKDSLLDKQEAEPVRIGPQLNSVAFGTHSAKITLMTGDFSSDSNGRDLDCPTEGFSSIPDAVEDIRQGKLVIVVDDEDRENEGDLIMAASTVTPKAMAFIVKHGTGIASVSMTGEDLERLQLPLMVTQKENIEKLCTAFTVTVGSYYIGSCIKNFKTRRFQSPRPYLSPEV